MIIILITTFHFHFLKGTVLLANSRCLSTNEGVRTGGWVLKAITRETSINDSLTSSAVRWRPNNWGSFTKDLSLTNLLARRPATKHLIEIPRKPHQMNWLLISGEGIYQLDNNFTRQSTCYPITRACPQDSCVLSLCTLLPTTSKIRYSFNHSIMTWAKRPKSETNILQWPSIHSRRVDRMYKVSFVLT